MTRGRGMDRHEPKVRRRRSRFHKTAYRGMCSCGWEGVDRASEQEAGGDIQSHVFESRFTRRGITSEERYRGRG